MSFPKAPFQSVISDRTSKVFGVWQQWLDRAQNVLNLITGSGATKNRPKVDLYTGAPYFDTSLNRPVFWNGSSWVYWPDQIKSTIPSTMGFYYGSFYDTNASQVAANTTTAYAIKINTTAEGSGVTIGNDPSGNPTLIKFQNAGVYNIQYSIQFTNTDTQIKNVNVWLRKNDTGTTGDIAYSNSFYAITSSHGGIHGESIAAINYVLSLAAGDYLQLMWQPESTQVYIETISAGTTPTTPVSPGVILTVCQVR